MSWDTLVHAFRYAAAPVNDKGRPDRKTKARVLLSPLVVRAEGGTGPAAEVIGGVLHDRSGRSVAHAGITIDAEAASPHDRVMPLCEVLTPTLLRRGVVEQSGRLRLPRYSLLCDVIDWLRSPPEDGRPLRAYCFERKRQRRPFLDWLWRLGGGGGPADGSAFAFVWQVLGGIFQVAPQWRWSSGLTRRLLRSRRQRHGWYRSALGDGAPIFGIDFFDHVEEHLSDLLAATGTGAPGAGASHDGSVAERQRELDRLLVHALLADLARWARPSRLAPWRRRRVTRFVFLMRLPEEGMGPGNRWEHFFEVCGSAVEATHCGAALWVALAPADAAVAGNDRTLADAALMLRSRHGDIPDDVRPLRVPLPAAIDHPRTRPARRSIRPVPGPRAWAAAESLCVATALTLAVWGVGLWPPGEGPDRTCAGDAAVPAAAPDLKDPADVNPLTEYLAAAEMIERENERAEREGERGGVVRTIGYLGVPVTGEGMAELQRSDGAVPELRGVALAQRALNDDVQSNVDEKVWLRVELFEMADYQIAPPRVAREQVVPRAEDASGAYPLIGVVGIAQSWASTQEAVGVLSEARIPTIVTNATADGMQDQGDIYLHQIAPPSSREAEIASAFVREANVVRADAGGCDSAELAVVVYDEGDLYSRSLGLGFAEAFAREGVSRTVTMERGAVDVAESVCEHIQQAKDTPTVVYWAARAGDFRAFLDTFGVNSACSGDTLTVVGGNGLATPTHSELYGDSWLRLYHASHVLPVHAAPRSHVAETLNDAYLGVFGPDDPWRNDGHTALAYDAMRVLGTAANDAYRFTHDPGAVTRANVQNNLSDGIRMEGASGYLDYRSGEPVSRDKPLVILYPTDRGSQVVLECGAFARNDRSDRWGPEGEFTCPPDD